MSIFHKKSDYQKQCEKRINEVCGYFFANDYFSNLAVKHGKESSYDPTFEKSVLKNECENGTLILENIESRLEELLDLDIETLHFEIEPSNDTSVFKTQEDINDFMGPVYVEKKRFNSVKSNGIFNKKAPLTTNDFFKITELYEKGIFTEEEFKMLKSKYFNDMF